jgi:hypothetical protein
MAGVSKTNSFGTFLETIEKRSPPAEQPVAAAPPGEPPPASGITDVARRVLQILAKGPASSTELREQAGIDPTDALDDLTTNGFVARASGRGVRFELTEQGRRVVELLTA